MRAVEGLHEEAARLIEQRFPPEVRGRTQVLDLGAGFGAFSLRLKDIGFGSVEAWDADVEQFRVEGVEALRMDLDADFADGAGTYDFVVALEVVEHLENLFHFMRQVAALLSDGGVLLLSTPNVESAVGRVTFLRSGLLRWFGPDDVTVVGHINPVPGHVLLEAARRAGLRVVGRSSNVPGALVTVEYGARALVKGLIALLLYPLMTGNRRGDVGIWVMTTEKSQ